MKPQQKQYEYPASAKTLPGRRLIFSLSFLSAALVSATFLAGTIWDSSFLVSVFLGTVGMVGMVMDLLEPGVVDLNEFCENITTILF
jgi:hypothetical protein